MLNLNRRPKTRNWFDNSERFLRSKKRKSFTFHSLNMVPPPKDRVTAKWMEASDIIFIDLCLLEVGKGNRPGTSLSKEGWKNVVKEFATRTGSQLDQKQLKNRWDQMKKDWSLYNNLMKRSTGIGWDPIRKQIEASDEWWEDKIAANSRYKKFQGKDLTIFGTKYEQLFHGTVATGMGARASTQPADVGITISEGCYVPDPVVGAEGSGDSDDIVAPWNLGLNEENLFPPSPDFEKGNSSGQKRKRATTSSIKEGIQSLLNIAKSKSTEQSTYVEQTTGPTIEDCMTILNGLEDVPMYSNFYYFAMSLFGKTANRELFVKCIDDRARVGWLNFRYSCFERGDRGD